jgi:hypothetical protein
MHIEITCKKCGEPMEATAKFLDDDTIEFLVDPCTSFECTGSVCVPEEPLTMPYATLVRILKEKQVTVVYRKINGDLRELTGFLGEKDKRSHSGKLVYFHELIDRPVAVVGAANTAVKCLMVDRIHSVEHVRTDTNQLTLYNVMEAL